MKKYLTRYFHKGHWYSITINANGWDDAEEICRRHVLKLDGEHMFTLRWPFGWLLSRIVG